MANSTLRKTILLMDVSNDSARQACVQFLELGYNVRCLLESYEFADAIHDYVFEAVKDKSIIGDRLSFVECGGQDLEKWRNTQQGINLVAGLSSSN